MVKRWQRVPTDADIEDYGGRSIIRITRGTKGDAMASVETMEWFEPDGHAHTGYAYAVSGRLRPAIEVLAEYRKLLAVVAVEDETLWDAAWGDWFIRFARWIGRKFMSLNPPSLALVGNGN